ncbi:MAG: FecCD family ABC transporter permease [Hyphomicrobiales bacterium]
MWQAGFLLALLAAMIGGLCLGRLRIPAASVMTILLGKLGGSSASLNLDEKIVLLVRAPRVLVAALSGAGLAMCGAALQGIFRNPLVSPQILGISGGAAFGGAAAILIGWSGYALIGSAFLFGMLALALVGFIARVDGRTDQMVIVLAGIVIGALFTALVSLIEFVADPDTSLPAIVVWLMGSFALVTWQRALLAAPIILFASAGLFLLRFRVNVLSMGDDEARSFGVEVERDKWIIFTLVGLLTGAVIAVAGIVGWVGLVIPHAARLLIGPDNRDLLPASALLGGTYLVIIDTLARTLTPAEIPLGVLTAIVGAPVFALLLRNVFMRRQRS